MTTELRGQAKMASHHEQARGAGPSRAWLERTAGHFR